MKSSASGALKINLRESGGRKALSLSQESLVQTSPLQSGESLPLLVEPALKGVNLVTWARSSGEFIETKLLEHGGILFRNFDLHEVSEFEPLIQAISGEALEYRYRASPRSSVMGHIYTSTDYPAEHSIFPHNEHAYSQTFPLRIYFFCVTPALQGGETPIGSTRRISERLSQDIKDRFRRKKVLYVRNYNDGFGLSWQTVFQTSDRTAVEDYCHGVGMTCEWKDGNRLRTRQIGEAIMRHPRTGEAVWFNHATFFHVTTLEATVRDALLAQFDEYDLPTNTFYGDASPIEPDVLEQLREAYRQSMITFSWQRGDVLLLDNMLAVHGRTSFAGPRKILVGMSEPVHSKQVKAEEEA